MLLYLTFVGVFGDQAKALLLAMMSGQWEAFSILLIDCIQEQ